MYDLSKKKKNKPCIKNAQLRNMYKTCVWTEVNLFIKEYLLVRYTTRTNAKTVLTFTR
jgi:hypothetical protein